MRQGQREGNCCPVVRDARQGQCAPMSHGDALSDGKSKTRPSCLARARLIHTVEAFAQMRQVLACNADPGVAHLKDGLSLFLLRLHRNLATMAIVFDRVVK